MVALDTDVLLLAFAFHRDERQAVNRQFLTVVQAYTPVVGIYSVMELLGKLSFNLSSDRLAQWPLWLQDRYQLTIIYPRTEGINAALFFQREIVEQPLEKMQQSGMPFLDGLILSLAEATQVDLL
ncbi:MAG: hypothetical protein R3C14_47420 [Caldilineaceae bacterium]